MLCCLQIVCPLHEQYYMIEITIMVFLCHWVACWVDCCVCVVTSVLCESAWGPTVAPSICTCIDAQLSVCLCVFFVILMDHYVHTFVLLCECVCTRVHLRACSLPHLCYSLSIVNKSVEQDPDPPVGTNHTHSSGLNSQLTIREPLSPCLLVRHT